MNADDFAGMLKKAGFQEIGGDQAHRRAPNPDNDAVVMELRRRAATLHSYDNAHNVEAGDFVQWKEGGDDTKNFPQAGQPMLVLRRLPDLRDMTNGESLTCPYVISDATSHAGGGCFMECQNLVVLCLGPSGLYHSAGIDQRHVEPYQGRTDFSDA
ncbi:hypothetical protein [Fodinicurvata sediminis]|uniref:hypothetical protein n=1 Tax=Fodinicurvata sediminis TaxID=1121832 RepID=UPI0003B5F712|nr:hypothetical protein [Fodinicurvata sediminis]